MDLHLDRDDTARVGPYHLLGVLGQGGMGTVYLARDAAGRQVAVKVVRAELAHDQGFRRRFRSEVNRARQVPPFCTAEVLDADPDHDPPYLVVEYVDGPSLYAVVQRQGPLTGTALHSLAVGVATALTAIHGSGVIHRDLKPGNVLLTLGGIKVIDFGLARALEATSPHTVTGHMVGTISYMAPERFEAEARSRVSPAADIFSWGAVVAFAATGRTPFGADSVPGTAVRIMTQPPDLTGVPMSLREPVARALAKQPHDRPTARELLDLLLAGAPSGATARVSHETPFLREIVQPADRSTADVPVRRPVPAPRRVPGRSRNRRPDLRHWPARLGLAALLAAMLAGGLAGRALLTHREAGADRAPAATGVLTGPSPQPVNASVPAQNPDAVLAGQQRTLLHLADTGKNLAVRADGKVAVSPADAADAQFVLVPRDGAYLIRSLRDGLPAERSCLGVRTPRNGLPSLAAGACADGVATLFEVAPTAGRDKENRPTYRVRNRVHGVVRWSDDRFEALVEQPADESAGTAFSLVDRGPA
ncbi:serine/threonine-protein kinase [Jidongwangia harbinensis]|uniref:serine/threonine-protein kinase n=1 Tax=Jidongwangia harbinensis TaxID=2878561 RepID=UPI001CD9DAD9|nr:serine/threonine-protein kinase [Jidongwangia harbinensis]MCA2212056.1 serine/threonine protein kinase [Jidongwangia harbinensis]